MPPSDSTAGLHRGKVARIGALLHRYFLPVMLAVYVLAGVAPGPGAAIRNFAVTLPGGSVERVSMLLLAVLLFCAAAVIEWSQLRDLIEHPSVLLGGLLTCWFGPALLVVIVGPLLTHFAGGESTQGLLVGLALVAAMPVANSSAGWTQTPRGNVTLSLGLIVLSILLSPLATPNLLKLMGLVLSAEDTGHIAQVVNEFSGWRFILWVILPSIAGALTAWQLGARWIVRAKPWFRLITLTTILVLNYANASLAVENIWKDESLGIVLIASALALSVAILGIVLAHFQSKLSHLPHGSWIALVFSLSMKHTGLALVLAGEVLNDQRVILVILLSTLAQHVTAAAVGAVANGTCAGGVSVDGSIGNYAIPASTNLFDRGGARLGLLFAPAEPTSPTAGELANWGVETLQCIDRDYKLSTADGVEAYAEALHSGNRRRRNRRQPAFMWSTGVHLSALAAAARFDADRYDPQLRSRIESLAPYWHEHEGLGGYDASPRSASADRYYDDNAWIVLALIEAHEALHDASVQERARLTQAFVLSGEDDQLSGGIFSRENERTSKNTCINAPAALAALMLHKSIGRIEDRQAGERLAAWTAAKLQDPASGLYWDHVTLDGRIDRRLFSYNSAVMIRVNLALYALTSDAERLTEAKRLGLAAVKHWIDPQTGAVHDGGPFAHMLLESLLELSAASENESFRKLVKKSAAYVHDQVRNADGRYGSRWDEPARAGREDFKLIDQAAAARLYFAAANALR